MLYSLLSKIQKDLLLRNAFILMVNTALASLFGFIFWVIAAHRQSSFEVGTASAIISLLPLAATIGGLGLDAAVFRHFALSVRPRRLVISSIIISGVLSSLVGFIFAILRFESSSIVIVLTLFAAGFLGINAVTTSAIMASRRSYLLLIESFVAALVKVFMLLLLPSDSTGLLGAMVAGILASVITSSLVLFYVIRPTRGDNLVSEKITGYAASNWIASSFSLLPMATLPMLVIWRAGAESAAYIAIAVLISPLLRLVPSMVTRSFFAEVAANPSKIVEFKVTFRLSLLFTTAAALVLGLLAPYVLNLFGSNYRENSTVLLRLLSIATVISVANYLADAVLNLLKDHRAFVFTNIFGMSLLTIILVIFSTWGAVGIGIAWIIGELLYALISWSVIFARHRSKLFVR